ncbi:mRNA decay activator protein ZFP36L3-like [Cydia fagiglandana]|uniref:mRNA decay activator protein ZFP36L3-like n=1 Tax=Cydia fagiglandana TaxID=1458189 RepID=UPI002FEE41EF
MEFRLFIVSLACLCCLTPPALGSVTLLKAAAVAKGAALLKAAAVAKGAALLKAAAVAKGAALLGAGALIKGAAIKGAIKGAAAKGAAILAAKGAAVKGALAIAAKAADIAVHKLPPVQPPPVLVQPLPPPIVIPANTIAVETAPSLPPVLSSLTSLLGSAHSVVQHKIDAVSNALHPPRIITAPAPVLYKVAEPAQFYPLIQRVEEDCL